MENTQQPTQPPQINHVSSSQKPTFGKMKILLFVVFQLFLLVGVLLIGFQIGKTKTTPQQSTALSASPTLIESTIQPTNTIATTNPSLSIIPTIISTSVDTSKWNTYRDDFGNRFSFKYPTNWTINPRNEYSFSSMTTDSRNITFSDTSDEKIVYPPLFKEETPSYMIIMESIYNQCKLSPREFFNNVIASNRNTYLDNYNNATVSDIRTSSASGIFITTEYEQLFLTPYKDTIIAIEFSNIHGGKKSDQIRSQFKDMLSTFSTR